MVWSRNDIVLRAVEAALGVAVAIVLLMAFTDGWFTTGAQKFSDWYASQMDGVLEVTVVSTTVKLPPVERADLPLPDRDSWIYSRTDEGAGTTSSPGAEASPSAG
ncbi:hypothetical protein [Demequina sp.]|uniref:hypothetical protein n=1 Tax=Demequina sp. TaxID=2050685 RepID=UPI0025C26BAB|nr:hypothetical protein [Demequina sp.]